MEVVNLHFRVEIEKEYLYEFLPYENISPELYHVCWKFYRRV